MYSDLKLLDEVLLDYMRSLNLEPKDMETYTSTTRDAISRLKEAYSSGEMDSITLTWANYFNGKR